MPVGVLGGKVRDGRDQLMSVVEVDVRGPHLRVRSLDLQGQRERARPGRRFGHGPSLLEAIAAARPPFRDPISRILEALDAVPARREVAGYAGAEGGGIGGPGCPLGATDGEGGDVQGVTTEREMDNFLIKSASRSLAEDGVKSVGGRDEGASAIRDPRGDKVRPG